MKVSKNDLKHKTLMNVGSGRESLGLLSFDPKKPSNMSNENGNEDKRVDDFNKKYEEFMNSRNNT